MANAIELNHDAVKILGRVDRLRQARERATELMRLADALDLTRASALLERDLVALENKIRFEFSRYVAKRAEVADPSALPQADNNTQTG